MGSHVATDPRARTPLRPWVAVRRDQQQLRGSPWDTAQERLHASRRDACARAQLRSRGTVMTAGRGARTVAARCGVIMGAHHQLTQARAARTCSAFRLKPGSSRARSVPHSALLTHYRDNYSPGRHSHSGPGQQHKGGGGCGQLSTIRRIALRAWQVVRIEPFHLHLVQLLLLDQVALREEACVDKVVALDARKRAGVSLPPARQLSL